jgi:hypothetical protein
MKGFTPSLVDVILTTQKNLCFNVLNIPTGVSDCHNLISVIVKGHVNRPKQEYIKYRSYKNFDEDISKINVSTSENLSSKEQLGLGGPRPRRMTSGRGKQGKLNNVYENYESRVFKCLRQTRTHKNQKTKK